MAWCLQATSHYMRQCWPRSMFPYGITRPQWVKRLISGWMHHQISILDTYMFVIGLKNHWFWCQLIEVETKWPPFYRQHFQMIFLKENVWISIKIWLKFVPVGPNYNIPTLVQIMAWCWTGDKPLSVPMMVRIRMHIYVTRLQWVKDSCLFNALQFSEGTWQQKYSARIGSINNSHNLWWSNQKLSICFLHTEGTKPVRKSMTCEYDKTNHISVPHTLN